MPLAKVVAMTLRALISCRSCQPKKRKHGDEQKAGPGAEVADVGANGESGQKERQGVAMGGDGGRG